MSQTMSVIYLDANGYETIRAIRTASGASAILAAILTKSNADYVRYWESTETANGSPSPIAATYIQGNWCAEVWYTCVDGTLARLLIPAPLRTLMLADGRTVDPTQMNLINSQCVGHLLSSSGSPAVGFQAGRLIQLG